jgi:polyphenol oxidase
VPVQSGKKKAQRDLLQVPKLSRLPWLVHGFSTRNGGHSKLYGGKALNLGFTKDDSGKDVKRNRALFLKRIGAVDKKTRPWPLVTVRQIHSDIIHRVTDVPEDPPAGDGLVTNTPGILLAVLTADCLPVILADVTHRAVGVFHAGWRGTASRIVEKGAGEMRRWFGTDPRYLQAVIGPCVHDCCYEVGEELRKRFESQFEYGGELFREVKQSDPIRERYPLLFLTARPPGHSELPSKLFLNLVEANRRQLRAVGVPEKNITSLGVCTVCHPELLFSHRAEKGVTGRMMGAVGIRE